MHPILFRIPLPTMPLRVLWVLVAVAVVAAIAALVKLREKSREGASFAGLIAVGAAIGAVALKAETWQLGPTPIYSYGVMLGLSLVVGWYLTLGLAERDGLPKETMANNYVVTALAAIAGSRVLYVLTNLNEFDSVASMFAMRRGGLVAYGGFLGGLVGSYLFLRKQKIPLLPWADVAVPSLASGLMITRIGCYLFGCDFGQPLSESAPSWLKKLGSFPHWPDGTLEHGSGSPAWVQHVKERGLAASAEHSLPVHPTQLYESLVGLGLLGLLLVVRRRQKFRGEIFMLFAFAYGVCRFFLELLRDDNERGSIPPSLPEHVLIPACLALLALGFFLGFSKRIENAAIRRGAQLLAFLPAVIAYVKLKPASFGSSQTISLSTSQFVAVTTGFAAALAFSVFHKAAVDHPEFAMALRLPPTAVDEDEDEDDALPKRATTDDDASRPQRSKKARRSEVAKSARNASSKEHDATSETSDDPKARDSDAGA